MEANPWGFEYPRHGPVRDLSPLGRCTMVLAEHASGNLPEQQAFVALRLLRPDIGRGVLCSYLQRARTLALQDSPRDRP